MVYYIILSDETTYSHVVGYPMPLSTQFPEASPGPIDAADVHLWAGENSGDLYIIKDDVVYQYVFGGIEELLIKFTKSFSITSTDDHVFNAVPQSPPQMPSGITALHISSVNGKSYAFVGSELYVHQLGTGTWSYQGKVTCSVDEDI